MEIRAPTSMNVIKELMIAISTPTVIIPQGHSHVYVNKERGEIFSRLIQKLCETDLRHFVLLLFVPFEKVLQVMAIRAPISTNVMKALMIVISTPNVIIP